MPSYYFIYLIVFMTIAFLSVRFYILRRKSVATRLFIEATRAENNGHFKEAAAAYENALHAINKMRFQHHLKIKIIEKLKTLRTLKLYQEGQEFVRSK